MEAAEREARERSFWDTQVPTLDECLALYRQGPDANTLAMLDAVEPLEGVDVLDFACGVGITSAWASARGARVTGVDLSADSTRRATELCRALGVSATFVTGSLDSPELGSQTFDRIVGRFALHHVDCEAAAPALAARLRPGGTAAFLETMDSNPLLRFARNHLVGRFKIPRYGTLDEHPLTSRDLDLLERALGPVRIDVRALAFFHLLDRQVLQYRSARGSALLGALDAFLLQRLHLCSWSYHQVLIFSPPGDTAITL